MKKCSSCLLDHPHTNFQVRKASSDGFTASCKECLVKRDRARYIKERERRIERGKTYSKTEVGKASHAASIKKWQAANKVRRAANILLGSAVKSGRVVPWPVCSMPDCSSERPQAHHPDYDRPLDVVWLCAYHHKQAHALIKEIT